MNEHVPVAAVPLAPRRGMRMRTVVFGLVMLAVSVVCLLGLLAGLHFDPGTLALTLLVAAGAVLVLGGLTAAVRDVRREASRQG